MVTLLRIIGRTPLINWWGIIKMNHTYTFEPIFLGGEKARGEKKSNSYSQKEKTSSFFSDR